MEEARAALASAPPPSRPLHRETLLNGSSSFTRNPRGEPAPRIIPQPENETNLSPSPILAILFTPFKLLCRILSGSFRILGYLFPFLPRLLSVFSARTSPTRSSLNTIGRRPLNPRDTAARFAREFEEEYGAHSLHFFENGYAQAYDSAKGELKFLLVILISPEHDDNSIFIRETLLADTTVNYLNDPQNNILLWAGNVQDSEAYQISNALNCSKFPFSALIAYTPQDSASNMSTIARITGLPPPSTYVPRLRIAIAQHSPLLERVRATRAERHATQSLRNEQNSAYERSLTQDRERARLRREAESAKLKAEQEELAREKLELKKQLQEQEWKIWRAQQMSAEPGPEEKAVTRVSIRMRSGERVIRKFAKTATVEELYAFVECYHIILSGKHPEQALQPEGYKHEYNFRLVSPMPRLVYDLESRGTIGDRLGNNGTLIVESITSDDEEEE